MRAERVFVCGPWVLNECYEDKPWTAAASIRVLVLARVFPLVSWELKKKRTAVVYQWLHYLYLASQYPGKVIVISEQFVPLCTQITCKNGSSRTLCLQSVSSAASRFTWVEDKALEYDSMGVAIGLLLVFSC